MALTFKSFFKWVKEELLDYPEPAETPPPVQAGFNMNDFIPIGLVGILIYLVIKKA